jgi:hypothetical protein
LIERVRYVAPEILTENAKGGDGPEGVGNPKLTDVWLNFVTRRRVMAYSSTGA